MQFNKISIITLSLLFFFLNGTFAQNTTKDKRNKGEINSSRNWWDVLKYDIEFEPFINEKSLIGVSNITYKVVESNENKLMQIDLNSPLEIDSVLLRSQKIEVIKDSGINYLKLPVQSKNSIHKISIYYSGKLKESTNPPWEGGWVFTNDDQNRPLVTVISHGKSGTSAWFPGKDHPSDEPEQGATVKITVPDSLVGVSNGRLVEIKELQHKKTFHWEVKNSINPQLIVPYIGKYVNFDQQYPGLKGNLDLSYWVLDYNLEKAKIHFTKEVFPMLEAYEYWMGPYPFYEDSYKLIEVPYVGMEHQSAIAYGNNYKGGYNGVDISGVGLHTKWDFIIVHESAHEWFGNNISTRDLADNWVHEGLSSYAETLYVEYNFGSEVAHEYNFGTRKNIKNDKPIISEYNSNALGSEDMYAKAANMMHSIRNSINNDVKFRNILHGLNSKFQKQVVTSLDIEYFISTQAGFDYIPVFNQYLRNTEIPVLEYYLDSSKGVIKYRYTNCIPTFSLPLVLSSKKANLRIQPTTTWKSTRINENQIKLFVEKAIEKKYYIKVNRLL